MRPLDWLFAVPGALAIAVWLIEQVTAIRRSYLAAREVISDASSRPAGSHAAVFQIGPLAGARRPGPGRRIAAGGQQIMSIPRSCCSSAARKQQVSGGSAWREPDRAGHGRVPCVVLGPPQPGGTWPQPSLN